MSGKQSSEYFKEYFKKNKLRISKRNKELYLKRRSTKEGLENHRKKATEATNRYRLKHPEKAKQIMKNTYWNRKKRAMDLIGGPTCVSCGCNEIAFLEINHIEGGGCKDVKENGNRIVTRLLTGDVDSNGFNVLCRACNAVDYLMRKKPKAKGVFKIVWEEYSGKKAKHESNKSFEEIEKERANEL